MKFKLILPKECIVKAGGIPIQLLESVECEIETPVSVDITSVADEGSIGNISKDKINWKHKGHTTGYIKKIVR